MKGLITLLAVLVVVGLAFFLYRTPTAPPEMTEAEIAQIEAEAEDAIADRWTSFRTALMGSDADAFLSHWTEDMRFLEPGMNFGRDDYESLCQEVWGSGGAITAFEVGPSDTFVHGNAAYQVGQIRETLQFPGGEPEEFYNNFFARWEKGPDGVWRVDRFVAGPVDAPAEG
jgi:ketosteroid isomerase-like protein